MKQSKTLEDESVEETKQRYELVDIVRRGLVGESDEFSAEGMAELVSYVAQTRKEERDRCIETVEGMKLRPDKSRWDDAKKRGIRMVILDEAIEALKRSKDNQRIEK